MNEIIFEEDLKNKILSGFEKLYKVVSCTLGPKGKNVIISNDSGKPFVTNDGVTIANAIKLEDEVENIIIDIIKESANKTNDNAGDGTTTSIVLAYELYKACFEKLKNGEDFVTLISELKQVKDKIIDEINNFSFKDITLDDIYKIAKVSCANEEISNFFKMAYSADEDIDILIKDSGNKNMELEIINGMKINSGFGSYSLIDDNKYEIEINKPSIRVYNNFIYNLNEIDISYDVIIALDYDEGVIDEIKNYNLNSNKKIYFIKAPYYGDKKEEILKDIEFFIKTIEIRKIRIRKDETILITSEIKSDNINERIKYLKERLENEEFEYEKDILRTRISSLKGKLALLWIGAPTEVERVELKMRAEDALYSVKYAKESGYVLGGGLTFYNISRKLNNNSLGEAIMKDVLVMPMKKIVLNSGYNPEDLCDFIGDEIGFNAYNASVENLFDSGIFDSSKVLIEEIVNSVSVVTMLLSTDVLVINKNNNPKIDIDKVL